MPELSPRNLQIFEQLQQLVVGGEWRVGQRLPTEQELVARFGVSRPTMRLMLDRLTASGVVGVVEGNGRKLRGRIVLRGQASTGVLAKTIVLLRSDAHAVTDPLRELGGHSELAVDGAITAELQRRGWHCLNVAAVNLSAGEELNLIAGRPAGFMATETIGQTEAGRGLLRRLVAAGFPVVAAGSSPELSSFDRVFSDHERGAADLARWLIGRGRGRILIVGSSPRETYWIHQRIKGCTSVLVEAQLAPPQVLCISGKAAGDASESNHLKVKRFATAIAPALLKTNADAIMALTDWDASIVLQSISHLSKKTKPPLVTGYDYLWPSLRSTDVKPAASVDKFNIKIGEAMVKVILKRISRPGAERFSVAVCPALRVTGKN